MPKDELKDPMTSVLPDLYKIAESVCQIIIGRYCTVCQRTGSNCDAVVVADSLSEPIKTKQMIGSSNEESRQNCMSITRARGYLSSPIEFLS